MRKINDLVSGKPSNREGLWAMTNKLINRHPGLGTP
jgi:hypothetical protein